MRRPAPRSVRATAVAWLAATALLAGCAGGSPPAPQGGPPTTLPAPSAPPSAPGDPALDPAYGPFYDQDVDWSGCGGGRECTEVEVPLDWSDPAGERIAVAVLRVPAAGERVGSLLYNPGGPGVSGVSIVRDRADAVASDAVRERYDLVGFDPRGVGGSAPVDCVDDDALDDYLDGDPRDPADGRLDPADLERRQAEAEAFADGCRARSGELLAHVGTDSAARDLDVLRAVLGQERLDYLGASYGTRLGATYAGLFPHRVGRMVLDGGVDPSLPYDDYVVDQVAGLEQALVAYAEDCPERRDCPLRGDAQEAVEQVRTVLDNAAASPLRTDSDRDVPLALALTGVVATLYDEASWPVLDAALAEALVGDGTTLLALADAYTGRGEDGFTSNVIEANIAITCVDTPVDTDPAAMAALADRLVEASPTFGRFSAYGEIVCGDWPVQPTGGPDGVDTPAAPPILVVGTTGDPATPYEWSVALAEQLDARLLTWEGEGHTAYLRGSRCIAEAVDAYLLRGVLPGEGATCT